MEVFFADDSTQNGARKGMGRVIGLGGILVEEGALRTLSEAVDAIALEFRIPAGEELKWSPRPGSWIHGNLHGERRTQCYAQVLQAASAHNVRAIVACWDTGRTSFKGRDAFRENVKYLFERVTMHLEERDSHAIFIADRPGGGKDQEEEFLSDFVTHVQEGTEYVDADRVLLNVLTTSSHLLRHLQVADLVTGITTSMVCGSYDYAAALFPHVQPMLIKHRTTEAVGGTGLKVSPRELINIYRWVLKEKFYHTGGGATSYPLPDRSCPYFTSERE
jgi:Protein of unknown function (DUF3800)